MNINEKYVGHIMDNLNGFQHGNPEATVAVTEMIDKQTRITAAKLISIFPIVVAEDVSIDTFNKIYDKLSNMEVTEANCSFLNLQMEHQILTIIFQQLSAIYKIPVIKIRMFYNISRTDKSLTLNEVKLYTEVKMRIMENPRLSLTDIPENIVDDDTNEAFMLVLDEMGRDAIKEVLNTLTSRERKVLTLRFGLDGGKIESLSSVGKKLNIPLTGQAVRYIEARAIRKLRNPMRIKYIRNLL